MNRTACMSLVVAALLLSVQRVQGDINVVLATQTNGQIEISGNQAPPATDIWWEGSATGARTTRGGTFRFTTTNRPPSCVGRLSIGAQTRLLVISHCLPAPAAAGMPRTGQTLSIAAGDDGALRKGTPWPEPRFVANGNGTVTDKLTSLVWLQDWTCLGRADWMSGLSSVSTLADGTAPCNLSDGSAPGAWRLPNRNELASVVDLGRDQPALPIDHPFLVDVGDGPRCWSSTIISGSTYIPWVIDFTIGSTIDNTSLFEPLCVTAVRDEH